MRDRQVFETTRLENGIIVHHYPTDQPFALFNVRIPIGSAHNTESFPSGTAHFLEHLALLRSARHPERSAFSMWMGLHGGDFNGFTNNFDTTYVASVPAKEAAEAWEGFCSQVFETIIQLEDLDRERAVISNERRQERWYPGTTELSHYLWTSWINTEAISKRQLFGNDDDLGLLTPDILSNFHERYCTSDIHVVVGGTLPIELVTTWLSQLKTASNKPTEAYAPFNWQHKEYHEQAFADVEIPIYFTGVCHALPPYEERVALRFLLEFLVNTHHGPLYRWLRDEKGWAYSMHHNTVTSGREEVFVLEVPLHNASQVAAVREEIDERIKQAILDESLLAAEVERQLGAEVFAFQTLESIIDGAMQDIGRYGHIVSEEDYRMYKKRCMDPAYMRSMYEKYFSHPLRGEFCALPGS